MAFIGSEKPALTGIGGLLRQWRRVSDDGGDRLGFVNGMHRTANMINAGAPFVPLTMDRGQETERFKQIFGCRPVSWPSGPSSAWLQPHAWFDPFSSRPARRRHDLVEGGDGPEQIDGVAVARQYLLDIRPLDMGRRHDAELPHQLQFLPQFGIADPDRVAQVHGTAVERDEAVRGGVEVAARRCKSRGGAAGGPRAGAGGRAPEPRCPAVPCMFSHRMLKMWARR